MTDIQMLAEHPGEPAAGPSRGVRWAWLVPGGILAVAALLWGTFNVLSLLAHENSSTTTSFAAADVMALDVATDTGSIHVVAGDVDEIVVTADISSGWQSSGVDQRVVADVLELRGTCPWLGQPWCSVDFTVTIPADRRISLNGSDGSISVRGMTGPIDVDNDNGSITLEDDSGTIRATNDNGRITGRRLAAATVDASTDNGRIELSFLDPPDSVTARTDNGRIEIVVPDDDVLYRVDMSTDHGSTDNAVRTDPNSDRVIDLTSDHGSITVRPPG